MAGGAASAMPAVLRPGDADLMVHVANRHPGRSFADLFVELPVRVDDCHASPLGEIRGCPADPGSVGRRVTANLTRQG
jgi:hypothetical protein